MLIDKIIHPRRFVTFLVLVFSCFSVCLDEIETYKRNQRRRFSANEKSVLEQSFANDAYPTTDTVSNLSKTLGLSTIKLNNWFSYERTKRKKIQVSKPCKLTIFLILQLYCFH